MTIVLFMRLLIYYTRRYPIYLFFFQVKDVSDKGEPIGIIRYSIPPTAKFPVESKLPLVIYRDYVLKSRICYFFFFLLVLSY